MLCPSSLLPTLPPDDGATNALSACTKPTKQEQSSQSLWPCNKSSQDLVASDKGHIQSAHESAVCTGLGGGGMQERKVRSLSRVRLFVPPWTVARQALPSMGFSRQEYWSGLPFSSPGDLSHPGIKPVSLARQADSRLSHLCSWWGGGGLEAGAASGLERRAWNHQGSATT